MHPKHVCLILLQAASSMYFQFSSIKFMTYTYTSHRYRCQYTTPIIDEASVTFSTRLDKNFEFHFDLNFHPMCTMKWKAIEKQFVRKAWSSIQLTFFRAICTSLGSMQELRKFSNFENSKLWLKLTRIVQSVPVFH